MVPSGRTIDPTGPPAVMSLGGSVIAHRLFVGNLNYETTEDQLLDVLAEAGTVTEIFLPSDRATGRPRGFAFVEFATAEEAEAAIEKFDGYEVNGRPLRVNLAEERRPRSFAPSGGGGGGGGGGFERPPWEKKGGGKPKGSRRGARRKKRSL